MVVADFGNKLRNLRQKNNISQENLGKILGISKGMLSSYESSMRMPTYGNLIKLALYFNVTTDYLLGIERDTNINNMNLSDEQSKAIKNLINAFNK